MIRSDGFVWNLFKKKSDTQFLRLFIIYLSFLPVFLADIQVHTSKFTLFIAFGSFSSSARLSIYS